MAGFFALLLLTCIAAPVLAATGGEAGGPRSQASTIDGIRVAVADARAVAKGEQSQSSDAPLAEVVPPKGEVEPAPEAPIDPTEAEREEARQAREREEALSTPEAIAERQQSRFAYVALAREQSEELLRQRFSEQLKALDADPSRVLSEVSLEQVISPSEALVSVEGERAFLESSVPLRTPDKGGELAKVDLGLDETERGYEPANSLAEVSLPRTAAGEIRIGEIGLSLLGDKAAASTARPFSAEDLYLPEAAEDTGLLLSPTTGGVELSALVLSRHSPEQLNFAALLPPGTDLRSAPDGGAEVIDVQSKEQEVLARISAPQAVDAQGTVVPSSLSVKEGSLVVEFPHRSLDVAYPIFVDPEVTEDWTNFADTSKLNYWNWQYSGVGSEDFIGWRSCIVHCWGNGLYVRSRSEFNYPASSYGRWWFVPQGSTTYMRRVILGPMNYDAHGCTANEPHPYTGVWNDYSGWKVLANAYPSGWGTWVDTGAGDLGAGTRTAFVGIQAASAAKIKCGHDYALGGAVLYLSDPENPSLGTLSGYPTKWVSDDAPFTVKVPVSDPGLGVFSATISPKGAPPLGSKSLGCSGSYTSQCPANHTFEFSVSAKSFDQGEKEVQVSAEDILKKTSSTTSFTMKVDRGAPVIDLDGQLAEATEEEGTKEPAPAETEIEALPLPVYNLEISTTDQGSDPEGKPQDRRSGVKRIEVFLDEEKTPRKAWSKESCPASSCAMTQNFTLKLNELAAIEKHVLRIVATDFADNANERDVEFRYIPATGIKGEYVMQHFPLPSGQGNEDEEENPIRPELAVNLVNGNLVYRQLDVEVSGVAADLEVERYYNSLLPESQDTEWGDGWTLAQTPTLEAEEPEEPGPPTEALLEDESGALEDSVELPVEVGDEVFDEDLQAVVGKEATGFTLTDESGETTGMLFFSQAGEATELEASEYASVEYNYEDGLLTEIAVNDVASTDMSPEEAAEQEDNDDFTPLFKSPLGSPGTADGQLKDPNDVAVAPDGTVWVVDSRNNRVQHFSTSGEYLGKFGSTGTANGQFQWPVAIEIDSEGDLWVDDMNNNRVQQFDEEGKFLSKFGSCCTGEAQISDSRSLAIDANDHIWVADAENHVIKEFNQQGEFVKSIGRKPGQTEFLPPDSKSIGHPLAVDIAPNGDIWVADTWGKTNSGWSSVLVFNQAGEFQRRFGSRGQGQGEFAHNDSITVDENGYVWVGDSENHRVQIFNEAGEYITEFGEGGSGAGQFAGDYAMRIALGDNGDVWVVDAGNGRVQRWRKAGRLAQPEGAKLQDDPSLEVSIDDGLVESVEGEEAGAIAYVHDDELLTAVEGLEGETSYDYDEAGRMTKVELPNGTYGEIAYEETYGRVKSITVAPEGANPKTTYFNYEDQPKQRTTVTPPAPGPVTTYEIAPDGSILQWWDAVEPPEFDLAGTLADIEGRETSTPIAQGAHNLIVEAHSEHGVASIQIVANNNMLVSEKSCDQIPGPPIECRDEIEEWVTETANWQPGIVYLEAIVTDALGGEASQRFWVNIPYTPPPDPEAEEPPLFNDVLEFREEFGLDLDLKGDEQAINDRIFDLMGAWHNPHTPLGEVARATWLRWGQPLRPVDAAELEYREWFYHVNAARIDQWVSETSPNTYAGYYIDHRAGGIMHIGFTKNQMDQLASLKVSLPLVAAERLQSYPSTPTVSYLSVQETSQAVFEAIESSPILDDLVVSLTESEAGKTVHAGTPNVALVESTLNQMFGPDAPIMVDYATGGEILSGRYRTSGRIRAGDNIVGYRKIGEEGACTAGFGAYDKLKAGRKDVQRKFLLTAGHCFRLPASEVYRTTRTDLSHQDEWVEFGQVKRDALSYDEEWVHTDAEAIWIHDGGIVPQAIFGWGGEPLPTKPASRGRVNDLVCFSGARTQTPHCGPIVAREKSWQGPDGYLRGGYWVVFDQYPIPGDSGAPVWAANGGGSIGLVVAGRIQDGVKQTLVEPLLHPPNMHASHLPGILHHEAMQPLNLKLGRD